MRKPTTPTLKTCAECGWQERTVKWTVTCSPECRMARFTKSEAYLKAHKNQQEKQRLSVAATCGVCLKPMMRSGHSTRIACSSACKWFLLPQFPSRALSLTCIPSGRRKYLMTTHHGYTSAPCVAPPLSPSTPCPHVGQPAPAPSTEQTSGTTNTEGEHVRERPTSLTCTDSGCSPATSGHATSATRRSTATR